MTSASHFQRAIADMAKRYSREQTLMLSVIHTHGMQAARDHLGSKQQQSRIGPTSWLGQQRRNVSTRLVITEQETDGDCSLAKRFAADTMFPI